MLPAVDKVFLATSVAAPEHEDDIFPLLGNSPDDRVGEDFPTAIAMRCRAVGDHCQDGVQEKDALFGPMLEIARGIILLDSKVAFDLLINILQRWRGTDVGWHGKAEAMRLAIAVIGILSEDDDFHLGKGRQPEGFENILRLGKYLFRLVF